MFSMGTLSLRLSPESRYVSSRSGGFHSRLKFRAAPRYQILIMVK
jgi:hypothetical protein